MAGWLTSPQAAEVLFGPFGSAQERDAATRRIRYRGETGALRRQEKPDGNGFLYWIDEADDIIREVEHGQKEEPITCPSQQPGGVRFDADLDIYLVKPRGRGRRWRQLDGYLGRAISRYEAGKIGGLDRVSVEPPPRLPRVRLRGGRSGFVAVVNATDVHVGKRSLRDGVCRQRERTLAAVEQILSSVLAIGQPDEWLLPWGGDLANADTWSGHTTRGTRQDMAMSYSDMVREVAQLSFDVIELLRQHAPVRLFSIPGNHDRQTMTTVNVMLANAYEAADDVSVIEEGGNSRHYHRFESNAFLFAHGDGAKPSEYPRLMQVERPDLWSECPHRFSYHGHLHSELELEHGGMHLTRSPSISAEDYWHTHEGYVDVAPRLAAYLHDRDGGRFAAFSSTPTYRGFQE